jgi:hypothetical protein
MSDEIEVVEAEVVDDFVQCQHFTRSGKQCVTSAVEGYPLCTTHLRSASVDEIALVRSKDVSFKEIRGRKVTNPLEELAFLVSEVLTYKDYCAMQVAKLRGDERYEGRGGEQLRAEVALYERSLDRAGKLLIEWSRLNIDERLARIEEAKAAAILEVIRRSLLAAELSDEARKAVEEVAIKELRALSRGNS